MVQVCEHFTAFPLFTAFAPHTGITLNPNSSFSNFRNLLSKGYSLIPITHIVKYQHLTLVISEQLKRFQHILSQNSFYKTSTPTRCIRIRTTSTHQITITIYKIPTTLALVPFVRYPYSLLSYSQIPRVLCNCFPLAFATILFILFIRLPILVFYPITRLPLITSFLLDCQCYY